MRTHSWRWVLPYAAIDVATACLAGVAGWIVARDNASSAAQPMRFTVDLPPNIQLTPGAVQRIVVSSDGRRIAYPGLDGSVSRLYVRSIDQLDSVAVRGVERLGSIFMSPDGEWIGFSDPGTNALRKVPVGGGPVTTICEVPGPRDRIQGRYLGKRWPHRVCDERRARTDAGFGRRRRARAADLSTRGRESPRSPFPA
jgi:hypothetical protein